MKKFPPISFGRLPVFGLLVLALLSVFVASSYRSLAAQDELTGTWRDYKDVPFETNPAESLSNVPCAGGLADIYPCSNVELVAFMPLADIGGGSGNDIWGWTDPLDGTEYALMGRSSGTSFVDMSDPENPVYLGDLPGHNGSSSSWRDIKVYDDHAFIVSEAGGHGMQVFDLTQLSTVVSPPVTFLETAHFDGFGSAHNIVINEDTGYAYGVGAGTCSGGLHFVDISTPTVPVDAGCYAGDGYTHDAQCVVYNGPDAAHVGQEICFNLNEDTLTIVDVEDKGNPVMLSRTGYVGSSYTHQGWLTDDHSYFLLDDETDEIGAGVNTTTYIWDVTDLDNPVNTGNYVGADAASDHNLYIVGNLAFESNYNAGLRILDIADVANANLNELAFFDVYPENNAAGTGAGSWSNYPYFASGVIPVSSIDRGLFLLRPTLEPDFRLSPMPNRQDVCAPTDAVYGLDVVQILDFTDAVAMSAMGVPAGATSGFSTNPVNPPGSTTFTVSNTGSATPGSYAIDVVGTATTRTHTTTLMLHLFDANPGLVTLNNPTDTAITIPLMPTFDWQAAAQGGSYTLDVATDAGFTNIIHSVVTEAISYMLPFELDTSTTYYWRVQSENACGTGAMSATYSFTTVIQPTILYAPGSIADSLDAGETSVETVTISNGGDLDLDWNAFDLPTGEELGQVNAATGTGSALVLGVEYVAGNYWITGGGISSTDDANYLWELDAAGNVLNTYVQPTTSVWGWRDLAYDGTYLYGSDSGVIEQIDPANGMPTGVTIAGPHNPNRGLAYDPATDHFWVSNQGAPIYEIDRDGNVINMYANPITNGSTEIYGLAWDSWSADGPFLWTWSDTPDNNGGVTGTQIDPLTGTETGVSFSANALDGAAGGATISPDIVPGRLSFAGMQQVGDDTIVVYELSRVLGMGCTTPSQMPALSVAPTSGTTVGGAMSDITVTFDATGLLAGVYSGNVCITSNDPVNPAVAIPFTYTVEMGFLYLPIIAQP